jgi:hypothetical protein
MSMRHVPYADGISPVEPLRDNDDGARMSLHLCTSLRGAECGGGGGGGECKLCQALGIDLTPRRVECRVPTPASP